MVFILPEVQSFGKQLGSGLGAGLSQASQFAQQMALQKQKSKPLEGLLNQSGNQEGFQKLSPQQEAALAFANPPAFNAYQSLKGSYQKEEDKVTAKQDLGNVLNQMTDTLKGGNLGYTLKKYASSEGRRDAQYFDSLGVQLESIAKEMVSKGVLAKDRFAYLLSNLPSSGKTDAANAGALEAWSDELKLERPEGLEGLYKKKQTKAKSSGKPILMTDAEGNKYNIPEDKVSAAEKQGFKRQ
jgi:hypothetical protein